MLIYIIVVTHCRKFHCNDGSSICDYMKCDGACDCPEDDKGKCLDEAECQSYESTIPPLQTTQRETKSNNSTLSQPQTTKRETIYNSTNLSQQTTPLETTSQDTGSQCY